MPYYNIQVVLAFTVDINFVNLWYFKHSFTFDDYVTIFADSHLLPHRISVCAGERILQIQQPLPQPRSRC